METLTSSIQFVRTFLIPGRSSVWTVVKTWHESEGRHRDSDCNSRSRTRSSLRMFSSGKASKQSTSSPSFMTWTVDSSHQRSMTQGEDVVERTRLKVKRRVRKRFGCWDQEGINNTVMLLEVSVKEWTFCDCKGRDFKPSDRRRGGKRGGRRVCVRWGDEWVSKRRKEREERQNLGNVLRIGREWGKEMYQNDPRTENDWPWDVPLLCYLSFLLLLSPLTQ